jgi:hypothetical protein
MSEKKLTFGCDPETAIIGAGGAIHIGHVPEDAVILNERPSTVSPELIARMMTPYVIEYRLPVNPFQNHMKRWMKGR